MYRGLQMVSDVLDVPTFSRFPRDKPLYTIMSHDAQYRVQNDNKCINIHGLNHNIMNNITIC